MSEPIGESEVLQLVLVLDGMGGGRGPRAFEMYQRALSSEIWPPLVAQQESLDESDGAAEVAIALDGFGGLLNPDLLDLVAREDEVMRRNEQRIAEAWADLYEQLKRLMNEPNEEAA